MALSLIVRDSLVKVKGTGRELFVKTKPQLKRAVFFDRDGVLNRAFVRNGKPYPPATIAQFEIVAGARDALRDLKREKFLLVVVTNQPDVARGTQSRDTVEQMNEILTSLLPIDDVFVCYHIDEDNCNCRKPSPGLLLQAAKEHGIDLYRSFMVGDRWRDVEAGYNAGCETILIDYGYDEKVAERSPTARVKSVSDAARWVIQRIGREANPAILL